MPWSILRRYAYGCSPSRRRNSESICTSAGTHWPSRDDQRGFTHRTAILGARGARCAMGKLYKEIDAGLQAFIEEQRMFFVATAPIDAAGHVNLSPKGLDTFRILTPRKV